MKKIIISTCLIITTAFFTNVLAQTSGAPAGVGTPAGGGDKNLQDTNIKMRSVELERAKRDAEKDGSKPATTVNSKAESKFPEIKEDFEGLQISQAAIIKTYSTDKKIDYTLIEISAQNIVKHTKRLDSNLFAPEGKKDETNIEDKSTATEEKARTLRDLIVDLDNAIGSFTTSPMFSNLKVVDKDVASKTRNDLLMIQELSEKISSEAKKLK